MAGLVQPSRLSQAGVAAKNVAQKTVQGGKTAIGIAEAVGPAAGNAVKFAALAGAAYGLLNLKAPTTTNNTPPSIYFPNDLLSSGNDSRNFYMQIQFVSYKRRSIFDKVFLSPQGNEGIYLPIPNNLVDTQTVTYGEEGADAAVGAAIEQGLGGGFSKGGIAGAIGAAGNVAKGLGLDTARSIAQNAPNGLKVSVDQILQMSGVAQNPFLTVLFKSPTFKQHSFSWKLAANNVEETEKIRTIIETIRYHMLPAMAPSQGGTLLTYPDMALIKLMPDDKYLYRFKPCVIESMSANYAPAASPAFFKLKNAPVEVQLSIQLKEIEYWLKEDVFDPSQRANGM